MTDITVDLLRYRTCVRELWNNYFIQQTSEEESENTYTYYYHVRETIFTSLISVHHFNEVLKPHESGFYNEIQVHPNLGPKGFRAMFSKVENDEYIWDYLWIKSPKNSFKYMDFFDWSEEQVMDCQYVEVMLVASDEFPELVGSTFLFDAGNVQYFKLEA